MRSRGRQKRFIAILFVGVGLAGASLTFTQSFQPDRGFRGWWNRVPPKFPTPEDLRERAFTFCRVLYESVRHEPLGHGWNTDYPDSDINFMVRLSELTTTRINRDAEGMPNHVVVTLLDDSIFNYPFVFMSDVGTLGFTEPEAARMREYLLRGGILYVDDFWGIHAFEHFRSEMAKVLPPEQYPVVDIPLDHPVFGTFFTIQEVPQVPSIQFWRRSGGTGTSERGNESAEPHFRGIIDERGRLMVIMTHNTDIADGWEREGEDDEFFYRFSIRAYPVGCEHRHLRDDPLAPIRVPLIARWRGRIEAGVVTDHVSASWDLLPTFASLAGAEGDDRCGRNARVNGSRTEGFGAFPSALKTSLAAANVAAAALGLVASRTVRRAWRPAVRKTRRAALPLLRFADSEVAALKLVPVEALDRLGGRTLVREFDESKSSRAPRGPIRGYEYLGDRAHLGKNAFELATRGVVAHITNEHFARNGKPPLDAIVHGLRVDAVGMPRGSWFWWSG